MKNYMLVKKKLIKKMVEVLMMPVKLTTLGLLEIKEVWNKVYDVIIFVHDVTMNFMRIWSKNPIFLMSALG